MSRKHHIFVVGIVIIAMMLWGMTFIWYKEAYKALRPLSLVFLRLFIASPVLLASSYFLGKLQIIRRKDLSLFLILALFEPFLYFMGESFGLSMVSSTVGAVIISTIPLFTPVVAFAFYKEKITTMNVAGIVISMPGVLMVISGESSFSGFTWWGVVLMFVAVFSAVGYSVMVRNLAIAYNVFSIVSWQTVLGLLYFLPIFLVFEWNTVRQVNWSLAIILPVAELALFGSALAFLFYTYSIKKLGMTRAAVYSNLIPVFTALFAWILLREKLTWLKINGMLIVISGLLLSQYNPGIRAENRKAG